MTDMANTALGTHFKRGVHGMLPGTVRGDK